MHTLMLLQVGEWPGWVAPTIAISLAVIALSIVATAIAAAIAVLRVSSQFRKIGTLVEGLQDEAAQGLKAARQVIDQGQDLMLVVRQEAGAFAQTGRRLRRKVVRGVDRIEGRLSDLETLYNVVHDEVEDTALDVAAAMRSVRRGDGMIGRVRRMLVAGSR